MLFPSINARKAILIVSLHFDEGDKSSHKAFGCALVVGIDRYPRRVTKGMTDEQIHRRSRMKPFIKVINYAHIMPTRYSFDVDFKNLINVEVTQDAKKKKEVLGKVKKVLGEKYRAGQNKWFFTKLRF